LRVPRTSKARGLARANSGGSRKRGLPILGHCGLILIEKHFESWQVRRMALEELLFVGN